MDRIYIRRKADGKIVFQKPATKNNAERVKFLLNKQCQAGFYVDSYELDKPVMKPENQTSKYFYRHSETGEIFIIERRWDGVLIGSCSPLSEPLKRWYEYEITHKNNLWIQENRDRLMLM
jgi:hypothetical protein